MAAHRLAQGGDTQQLQPGAPGAASPGKQGPQLLGQLALTGGLAPAAHRHAVGLHRRPGPLIQGQAPAGAPLEERPGVHPLRPVRRPPPLRLLLAVASPGAPAGPVEGAEPLLQIPAVNAQKPVRLGRAVPPLHGGYQGFQQFLVGEAGINLPSDGGLRGEIAVQIPVQPRGQTGDLLHLLFQLRQPLAVPRQLPLRQSRLLHSVHLSANLLPYAVCLLCRRGMTNQKALPRREALFPLLADRRAAHVHHFPAENAHPLRLAGLLAWILPHARLPIRLAGQ